MKYHSKENIHPTDIVLRVQDIDRSEEFYREVLGLKLLERKDREISLTADGKKRLIRLISPENVVIKPPRRTGLYHFALLLPNRAQLALFFKHIRRLGYPLIGASDHGVSQAVYLEDLDGNGIEVYADIDINRWHRKEANKEITSKPLDYRGLIKEVEGLRWKGLPQETIMGHIHLQVSDLEEAKKFYIDGIGLELIREIPNSAVFTASAGYHHHIAFNIWNSKGAEPLPKESVGMEYYSLKFPNEGLLKKTVKKLSGLGFKSFENRGKIFVEDPSRNKIALISQ